MIADFLLAVRTRNSVRPVSRDEKVPPRKSSSSSLPQRYMQKPFEYLRCPMYLFPKSREIVDVHAVITLSAPTAGMLPTFPLFGSDDERLKTQQENSRGSYIQLPF